MPVWLDLLYREIVVIAVLAVAGGGVVAWLGRGLTGPARVALAPAAGLALTGAVMTTSHLFLPVRISAWAVLLPLLLGSAVAAVLIGRREGWGRPPGRELAQMLVVLIAALMLLNVPLIARDSLGPMGYSVFDSNSYVGFEEASRDATLQEDISNLQADPDLTYRAWAFYSKSFVLIRIDSLAASLGEYLGWRSSDTQAAFMAALLAVGALALLALAWQLTRTRSWVAVGGALLFAGPVFFQIYIDGSQGLISGLSLIPAALAAVALYVGGGGWRAIALLGLLTAGMNTMHPVFAVLLVLWGGTYAAVFVFTEVRRRRGLDWGALVRGLAPMALVGLLAMALTPVATVFNFRFYDWSRSNFYTQGLPDYDLPLSTLPAWLLQTREFFFLPPSVLTVDGFVRNLAVPLLLAAAAVWGVRRYKHAWIVPVLLPASVIFGGFAVTQDCSYCLQRNVIPAAPSLVALVTVGLIALWHTPRAWMRWGGLALTLAIVGLAGHKSVVEARRLIQGGYAVPQDARDVLAKLPKDGPVYLEGIGQGRNGPAAMEMTALYNLANEYTDQPLAISNETNDYNGLAYLIGVRGPETPPGAEYTPGYRYVMTRLGAIDSGRRVIARSGPFAVEERARPFDVAVTSGVAVDEIDRDPQGRAWVQGPMTFWTSAESSQPAALELTFATRLPVRLSAPGNGRITGRSADAVRVCVPVSGSEPLRRTTVGLEFRGQGETPSPDVFGAPGPARNVELAGMRAVAGSCPKAPAARG